MPSRLVHLPYLLYTAAMWNLLRLAGKENPVDRVSEDLLLGRRLRGHELPAGIVNCVDLTSEFEEPQVIREGTNYINLPVLDADVPTREALETTIGKLKPGATFVHCAQGHGRTGLFALILLFKQGRIQSYAEGMALITKVRAGVGLNRAQAAFVRDFMATEKA